MIQSLLVLILTAVACSLLGSFLTLRKLSMMADAISHTVLLGIVLAFFITRTLDSPLLMVGAAVFGLVTVALVEALGKTKLIKYDDAIGVVFPMLFALAVILISRFARNVHLDTDIVLMGEVIFAPLDTVEIFGLPIARAAVKMGLLALINLTFVLLFYKELKVSTFDEEYAGLIGVKTVLIFYMLMCLTSLTAVAAFDAVGSVLVLSFFIAPAATAYLISKDLKQMLALSAALATINALAGYYAALALNASMAGMCAAAGMLQFMAGLLFNADGVITRRIRRRQNIVRLKEDLFIVHLANHAFENRFSAENEVTAIPEHLNWNEKEISRIADLLIKSNYVEITDNHYVLTPKGDERFMTLCRSYGLKLCGG